MKKITKTMMIMGVAGTMCVLGSYMYKKNNKNMLKKYKTYLEN